MSKKLKTPVVDLEKTIMSKVQSNEIAMKPRSFFVVGSLLAILGLAGLSIGAVFLTNLTLFSLRRHGPMAQWRLQQLLTSFPLWIPILAILGIVLGIWMLRAYDFSYKKNFWLVVLGFVLSVLLAAFMIDQLGLNDMWSRRGPMRQFYQQLEKPNLNIPRGPGKGRGAGEGRFFQQAR